MAPIAQFSGLASGIDSASLIDALITAKLRTNELRKNQITNLQSENDALEELNTKLLNLADLINKYRTANGGGINKRASSSDASVATAAVSAAAANASIGVTVTSAASAATGSFTDSYIDSAALFAPNAVGTQTITVQVGSGASQVSIDVDITNSTTVQQFIDSFNSNADAIGVAVASLVKVDENDYRVVVSSQKTGVNDGQLAFVIPSAGAGFGGAGDLQTQTIDQATDAIFSIDGISGSIRRSTNAISDVLTGVTFNIAKAGTSTITISDDADSSADSFKEIIEAFNDIVQFIKENDTATQDKGSKDGNIIYGSLGKTRLDNDFLSQFRETLLGANSGFASGAVQSVADLGISTNRDGTIAFDIEKFKMAVSSDSSGATGVLRNFADKTAGISGFIYQFTTFQGFIDLAQSANLSKIDNLNNSVEQLQRSADKMKDRLTLQFSRLESITADLQQKQATLTSALAGLSGK